MRKIPAVARLSRVTFFVFIFSFVLVFLFVKVIAIFQLGQTKDKISAAAKLLHVTLKLNAVQIGGVHRKMKPG